MKLGKKWIPVMMVAVIAAVAALLVYRYGGREDLRRLQGETYNAAFFSMLPYENMEAAAIGADFFSGYMGLDTATASDYLRDGGQLNDYLQAIFGSGNVISDVCLELLPFRMEKSGGLNRQISAHPDTTFRILFCAPSMDYWLAQSPKQREKQLAAYQSLAKKLVDHGNVKLYFLGAEDWLVMNRDNYVTGMETLPGISTHIALLTFCDDHYRLNAENYVAVFAELKDKIEIMETTGQADADLSDWCLVFFGDSIIGNYSDSTSIPNVTAALSGCQAYNLGIGGASATRTVQTGSSFSSILSSFFAQNYAAFAEDSDCRREMLAYYGEEHAQKQMCFVIHYGDNDYFTGQPIENRKDLFDSSFYAGALRSGIQELQEAFPGAVIILSAPIYTSYFSDGQEINSDVGGCFADYVEAAEQVADDMGIIFMNNYENLGVDASNAEKYMDDGAHLGDAGRFLYAQALVRLIQDNCLTEGQ